MVKYLTALDLRVYLPRLFVVLTNFNVQIDHAEKQYILSVPRGLITDLASVPKAIQVLPDFDVNGGSRRAAVMHDYLYTMNGKLVVYDAELQQDVHIELSRNDCDLLLREGILAAGMAREVADSFYTGVLVGGHSHWNNDFAKISFVPEEFWTQV